MREKLLLQRIQKNGDKDAFVELYNIYVTPLYRFVFLKLSNKEEAEDVVSDTFLRTWRFLTDTDKKEAVRNFKALLYKVARHRIIDTYRDRAKRRDVALDEMEAQQLPDKTDVEAEVGARHEVDQMLVHIRSLKQEYQEIIFLRYVEELSIADIASITQKKQTAVRVTLHRATKKLKALMDYEQDV